MLLQQIVEALDGELDRLYRLRAVLVEIDGPLNFPFVGAEPVSNEPASSASDPSVDSLVTAAPVRIRRAKVGKEAKASKAVARFARSPSRTPANRLRPKEKTALKGSVPTGPVVVSASALAKEHAARQGQHVAVKPTPPPPAGSLGSMIRALRLDGTA